MSQAALRQAGEVTLLKENSRFAHTDFLQVKACGICATDRKSFLAPPASMELPRVLGHEISGTLLLDVGSLPRGTQVVLWPAIACNSCEYCLAKRPQLCPQIELFGLHRDGGFSDTLSLPASELREKVVTLPLPPAVSHQEAIFAEPLGCVLHGLGKCSNPPEKIMIYGAGLMGCLAAQAAAFLWPKAKIMLHDIDPQRRTPLSVKHFMVASPKSADLVFIACSSKKAVYSGIELLSPGGTLVLFSGLSHEENQIEIDHNSVHRQEQTFTGSYGCTPDDMKLALDLVADNKVKVEELITQTVSLSQVDEELSRKTTSYDFKTILIPYQ